MASSILFNNGERAFLDALLSGAGAAAAYSPDGVQLIPPPGTGASNKWGAGLATSLVDEVAKTSDISAIGEIGTVSPAGYGRRPLSRDIATSWPAASLVSGSYQSAATQVTFTFSGAPSPNGANMWFLAGSDVIGADNALFGANLSAERTYASGNQHQVDCAFREA